MHHRTAFTTQSLALNDGNYNIHYSEEPASTVGKTFPKRRRQKPAFSRYYSFSSLWSDETIRVMAGIIAVLILIFFFGIAIIFRLLAQKGFTSAPPSAPASLHYSNVALPQSMPHIGDKSEKYITLRQEYESEHPSDPERSIAAIQELQKLKFKTVPNGLYDIYNCPYEPPTGYPYEWNTVHILKNWNPNDVANPPSELFQGLCVFNYGTDYDKAMHYRSQELPFVVRNDPDIAAAAERWNTPGYMHQMLGNTPYRAEHSDTNHFLYWVHKGKKHGPIRRGAVPKVEESDRRPTDMLKLKYQQWLDHANVTDESLLGPNQPHWYFRLIGCGEMKNKPAGHGQCDPPSEYLFDELPFFQPRSDQLYIVEPEQQKGIHCRFGMQGLIAENHWDAGRNTIVVLGGARRYILSHPNQCENLALYPKGHPSARHSAVNWADPDLEEYPRFAQATSNEVVLQTGDALYLPNYWFHHITSLSLNFQCNTRSGNEDTYFQPIHKCGF